MEKLPNIIQGGKHIDERGKLSFSNSFSFREIERFYIIEHPHTSTVRAWQAHRKEKKWFQVISGSFKVVTVKIDDWENPSEKLDVLEFILNEDNSHILNVPEGYATGFQAIIPDSKIICFSSHSVEDSKQDDFRFKKDKWYRW